MASQPNALVMNQISMSIPGSPNGLLLLLQKRLKMLFLLQAALTRQLKHPPYVTICLLLVHGNDIVQSGFLSFASTVSPFGQAKAGPSAWSSSPSSFSAKSSAESTSALTATASDKKP